MNILEMLRRELQPLTDPLDMEPGELADFKRGRRILGDGLSRCFDQAVSLRATREQRIDAALATIVVGFVLSDLLEDAPRARFDKN
jgi:hypothetical protein